jgi:ABC-type antimicrobial peptide transport system permease subunit
MIDLRENLNVALDTLRSHKVRSALTVLGIVIGVTSVISVAAIISGLNRYIQSKVEQFGPNTFFLSRIPLGPQGFGNRSEKIRMRKYLQAGDAMKLRDACPTIKTATIFGTRASFFGDTNDVRFEGQFVDKVILRGVEPEYADVIPLFVVDRGRFVSRYDDEHARPVAVLGAAIADSLFPTKDPLGKMVRINGYNYEVIGIFAHDPGLFGGPGVDQFIAIPFGEFHKRYPESKELIMGFMMQPGVPSDVGLDEVTGAMRKIRRVPPKGENDFEIMASDFLSTLWNQLTGALVILTAVISSVGLLVGGIGVMNIMLISVTERTAEIGVRKAMGARKKDIRIQFLMEATMLTVCGGAIGILFGGLIAFSIRTLVPSIPAALSLFWILAGVIMSMGVGLFFGYYPANRAAELDPIVCLRYE